MERKISNLGSIVYRVLFLPKIDNTLKDYIRTHYFEEDDIYIPENVVRHYNLNICERLISSSDLDPSLVTDFVLFRNKCKEEDIDYIEF